MLEPEPHDLEDLGLNLGIRGVEVRLEIIEAVEVPSLRLLVVRPRRFLHAGKHHAGIGLARLLVGPDVPVAERRVRIAPRRLEPGMLVRRVVDHEIDDHPDAALLGRVGELDEIAERAVGGVDAVVIADVIAVVLAGRGLERHQPNGGDAEPVQVIQAAYQPLEVADPVPIGIHVGADRQAVNHRILVPEVIDHLGNGTASARPARALREGPRTISSSRKVPRSCPDDLSNEQRIAFGFCMNKFGVVFREVLIRTFQRQVLLDIFTI